MPPGLQCVAYFIKLGVSGTLDDGKGESWLVESDFGD